jgi:hypothetical protein
MWLAMCLWHLPVYTGIAVSQTSILALQEAGTQQAWLDTALLVLANVSMLGVLGIFAAIFAGLIYSA